MAGRLVCYFGYGSLVNAATRPNHSNAVPACLQGWRRCWGHRAVTKAHTKPHTHDNLSSESNARFKGWTVLSVEQAAGTEIEGMLVTISPDELPALDEREMGYKRLTLPLDNFTVGHCKNSLTTGIVPQVSKELAQDISAVYMYASETQQAFDATEEFPLLQSYVDCVMAGYEAEFGASGLSRFMATTRGWQAPMIKERTEPRYVRSVQLTDSQAARYDRLIEKTCR